jgi:hypothetical protein
MSIFAVTRSHPAGREARAAGTSPRPGGWAKARRAGSEDLADPGSRQPERQLDYIGRPWMPSRGIDQAMQWAMRLLCDS